MELYAYKDAREFFESVKRASEEIEATIQQMEHKREKLFDLGSLLEERVSKSASDPQGTAKIISYTDFEQVARLRIEQNTQLIAYAQEVLYGEDMCGGVAHIVGAIPADIVRMRYIERKPIKAICSSLLIARATALAKTQLVFDAIDALGIARARAGFGLSDDTRYTA